MKILYATMQFARGYAQGTERYVAMLSAGMRARGHDVTILTGDPEHRGPHLKLGDRVPNEPNVLHFPSRGWMSVRGLPASDLLPLLQCERPDVVHIANPAHVGVGLSDAARAAGLPVVITVMDFWWLCPKHTLFHASGTTCDARVTWRDCLRCMAASDSRAWLRGLARIPLLERSLLPALYFAKAAARGNDRAEIRRWMKRQPILLETLDSADAVIFPSRGARLRLGPLLKRTRQFPIPYGLEPRWFGACRPPRSAGPVAPEHLVIGYAGALAPHKGPHLLLQAIRDLGWTQTRVRLAGGGTDERYVRRLHELAVGLNVEFAGRIDSAAMPGFLGSLDLFVMPSIWPENLPIVVLEAQAVAVPLLASCIDGVTEAVPDSMLFAPNSAADLARRLRDWAAEPVLPPPLQPVSTSDAMVERTLDVYRAVMARP